jgi:hypothetical protein
MMTAETRMCTECKVLMDHRLGQFECPKCGRIERSAPVDPAAAPPPPPRPSAAGPTSRHDPGAKYRQNAPPAGVPTPGDAAMPPSGPIGYGGDAPIGYGYTPPPPKRGDPLRLEKILFLCLQGASVAFVLIMAPSIQDTLRQLARDSTRVTPEVGVFITKVMSAIIYGGIVGLILYALVFFLRETWLKWSCIGLNGCTGLFLVLGMLMGVGFASSGGVSALIQLAILAWLISILYRDIQNLEAGDY